MKPTAAKTVSVRLIHPNHMPRMATYLLSLLFALAATCAQAATYYWKGVNYVSTASGHPCDLSKGYGAWDELSNWSTESETGADASAVPGYGDEIQLQRM